MPPVRVEVVGRPLAMSRGPVFGVGERFTLNGDDAEHQSMIRRGWVRLLPSTPVVSVSAHEQPPKHKQVRRKKTRRK